MKTLIIIPSRLSASRLPGKPLLKINGLSIISHVVKKAQDAITAMRPYSNKLTQILVDLSSSIDFENVYLKPRKVENLLVVCITSNRGLCGAFNSNVIKKCLDLADNLEGNISFFCIGKKGVESCEFPRLSPISQSFLLVQLQLH